MKYFRKILLPFSLIYWFITFSRNIFYNRGIFTSFSFPLPVIAIGNLSTGGTGKTPQTEYLIRLLSGKYKVATLSRGYKRKSKGFILADAKSNAEIVGDEPLQFHLKFPDIYVAVDADRKNGIEHLLSLRPEPKVILLDDAYQHRRVKAGFYVLLTAYGDLYADDLVLPAGNLREGRSGARRANAIIITKCPPGLSLQEQGEIIQKLKPLPYQKVYFTCIEYDNAVHSEEGEIPVKDVLKKDKVLIAGIAKPKPFFEHLQKESDIVLTFPDHHDFTQSDLTNIENQSKDKIIITTEKDYVRLRGKLDKSRLYYLPIKSRFLAGEDEFNKSILEYVGESTGNR